MHRPTNYKPHLHHTEVNPAIYQCTDCGHLGNMWEMDYTQCPNFSPRHVNLTKIKKGDWSKCMLCGEEWGIIRVTDYTICPVTQKDHGWEMDSSQVINNAIWKCRGCEITGSMEWLELNVCPSPDRELCEFCNVATQCAGDCPGMMGLLGGELP